jgi:hypothetical protein
VSETKPGIQSSTRPIRPDLVNLLRSLKVGQRIRVTQTIRMNCRVSWQTRVDGVYRNLNYLRTGIATDRVPEDDIVVVSLHFTKDNGELSCVTLDEQSQVEIIGAAP